MSISKKFKLITAHLVLSGALIGIAGLSFKEARADDEKRPIHFSAQKTKWNRKTDQVELTGKATVTQPGEIVTADYIFLDQASRKLDAVGHCVYTTTETVIYADELHLNMETRTGLILGGRVANDRFALTGERIEKVGDQRYFTKKGAYTTCVDCPQSWLITGDEIDMEFEGYAFMSNVTTRVKDAPFFWLPYLIVPMKRQRQTGFLFPQLSFFNGNFTYQFPFYWATSRSTDMTISLGEFAGRGGRIEWEGRYVLSRTDHATARFFFTNDQTFLTNLTIPESSPLLRARNRMALDVQQQQTFPFGIDQKLKILETSDNRYVNFLGDIPGRREAVLESSFSLSKNAEDFSFYFTAQRFRNLLPFDESSDQAQARSAVLFDTQTVQQVPSVSITTRDRFILGSPVAAGLTVGMSRFARAAGSFDRVDLNNPGTTPANSVPFQPGVFPIREANRFFLTPKLYTTLRPGGAISFTPSAEYRAFHYQFPDGVPSLTRGYLLLKADLTAQIQKIFENKDVKVPKTKHVFRPLLTYSLIPYFREDPNHPFISQMRTARENSLTGFNFDNQDIVPNDTSLSTANYFIPLGNSLTYGLTTQLIDRRSPLDSDQPAYRNRFEFRTGQTFNFRELRELGTKQPFSRLFAQMLTQGDRWLTATDYFYYPYISLPRHTVSTTVSYLLDRPRANQLYYFERSFTLGYSYNFSAVNFRTSNLNGRFMYSLNDYILPMGLFSFDFISKKVTDSGVALRYQSVAQCWSLDLGIRRQICASESATDSGFCISPRIDFQLNFAGQASNRTNPLGI